MFEIIIGASENHIDLKQQSFTIFTGKILELLTIKI